MRDAEVVISIGINNIRFLKEMFICFLVRVMQRILVCLFFSP
jgi:hypothetical protein